jgi:hypothetical protein
LSLLPQDSEFRPSIGHVVDIGRNTSGAKSSIVSSLHRTNLHTSSSGNVLLLAPHQVTHFSGPSMMFSPMKTPGRPRTAPAPPSSDFIKHPAPSPEVRCSTYLFFSCSYPSLLFLTPPLLQIKRARALVVPAHLLRKGDVEQTNDVPRPGERCDEMNVVIIIELNADVSA